MNTGRPTIDHKGESIRVRVNEDMRKWLYQISQTKQKSVSQIIRDLIDESMRK